MIIPPLPPSLHEQLTSREQTGPAFTALYRHLTTEVLDSDGGNKTVRKGFEEEKVDEKLHDLWVRAAREGILVRGLREICLGFDEGSGDDRSVLEGRLRDLCFSIVGFLQLDVRSREAEHLMAEEIDSFMQRGPEVGVVLGNHLDELEETVSKMAQLLLTSSSTTNLNDDQNPKLRSKIPLPSKSTTPSSPSPSSSLLHLHQSQTRSQTTQHSNLLTSTLPLLSTLLSLHSDLTTSRIHNLETHTYSTHSRHLLTQAHFLSNVAEGLALKAQILNLTREREVQGYEGMQGALKGLYRELEGEKEGLEEREGRLRGMLEEYEGVGIRGREMGMLGGEYGRLGLEVGVVREDLERLGGR